MMDAQTTLLIATKNQHKTKEFSEMLGGVAMSDLTTMPRVPEIVEDGRTFEENATIKALQISRWTPGLVLADDSGLEVDALNGEPGVHSARYAGEKASDAANRTKLLAKLAEAGHLTGGAPARFRCVLVLALQGDVLSIAHGTVEGHIIAEERGEEGFGYDSLFVPQGEKATFAELPPERKNKFSHRARALERMRPTLGNILR